METIKNSLKDIAYTGTGVIMLTGVGLLVGIGVITTFRCVFDAPAHKQNSAPAAEDPAIMSGDFWISSTGKTHVRECRYYANCEGKYSLRSSGNNCKICGESR